MDGDNYFSHLCIVKQETVVHYSNSAMTKLEFIQQQLSDEKLRKDLAEVVVDVEALIPQCEGDFAELQKFGLYPAEACVPFVTDQKTPFYYLDNMAVLPIHKPELWLHYGDFKFRQLEILYLMPRMQTVEAHEWLRDNLFQLRVSARKKRQYKSKFRGCERGDWKEIQTEWMKYCLNLKYRDHALFRKDLHATDLFPVEDATGTRYPSNLFWGAKLVEVDGQKYYFGCNVLGKLLAALRESKGYLPYELPADFHLFGKPVLEL